MGILVMVGMFLLSIAILVVIHEFGHFIFARAFGIKVEKFYLFMDAWGIKLFKYNYKGCEYGIGWLPLGGYVKIAGMIDESMDKDVASRPLEPTDFMAKPRWQRALVMLGGIIFNVVFGFLILWIINYTQGEVKVDNTALKYGVYPSELAENLGFRTGDKIMQLNEKKVIYFDDILKDSDLLLSGGHFVVDRGGQLENIDISKGLINYYEDPKNLLYFLSPRMPLIIDTIADAGVLKPTAIRKGDEILAINGKEVRSTIELSKALQSNKNKEISIVYASDANTARVDTAEVLLGEEPVLGVGIRNEIPLTQKEYGFFESLPVGVEEGTRMLVVNAKAIGKMIAGKVDPQKTLSGPVGIATMFGKEVNASKFWYLTALISLALAFFNILPIPALDGGHLVLLGVEAIIGKPLSSQLQYRIQSIGFAIVILLAIFILYSDIAKLVR